MNPYEFFLPYFGSNSLQELYNKLEIVAKLTMGLDELPFPLSALENGYDPDIFAFILKCNRLGTGNDSDEQAKKLIEVLKNNIPEVSYQNPKMPDEECSKEDADLIRQITYFGIDLPGSKHNPYGSGYYSKVFMDCFFGNFTEFMVHVNSLSSKDLKKMLEKREGYGQYSLLFAPILGLRIVDIYMRTYLTSNEQRQIKIMYSGNNEDRHTEILMKLIELGADPNANDIHGYTPLHHALIYINDSMVNALIKSGANPNSMSRNGEMPFTIMIHVYPVGQVGPVDKNLWVGQSYMEMVDLFLKHNAKLPDKKHASKLRSTVEANGSKALAVKVREAMPRDDKECEKCEKISTKKCSACGLVYYCSPVCQKQDWKLHKVTCQKIKKT